MNQLLCRFLSLGFVFAVILTNGAQAQIRPLARYKGGQYPIEQCSSEMCYIKVNGKPQDVALRFAELASGGEFGAGGAVISDFKSDRDVLEKATERKRTATTKTFCRLEADVRAVQGALSDCYGVFVYVANGSIGTYIVPIGKLAPGRTKHLRAEITHQVDAVGKLHIFSKGLEIKTNLVAEAYDAGEYFASLTRGIKGVSAVALFKAEKHFPHALSRDGGLLATIRKYDTYYSLVIVDLKSLKIIRNIKLGNNGERAWDFNWVSANEVAFIYDDPEAEGTTNLGLLNITNGRIERLARSVDNIVNAVRNHPDILMLFGTRWNFSPGIAKYDLQKRNYVESDRLESGRTLLDDNGDARIHYEDDGDGYRCLYKKTASASWRPLDKDIKQSGLKFDQRGKGMLDRSSEIHSVGPDGDTLYISTRLQNDCFAIAAFSLSKGQLVKTIAESSRYDLTASAHEGSSHLLYRKNSTELIGISYDADRPQVIWLDPAFEAAQKMINQARLGYVNLPQDWTENGDALIYFSYNDRDPGSFLLLRPKDPQLIQLYALGEHLKDEALGRTEPFDYPARDGVKIHAYVTYPPDFNRGRPAPLVVDVHGGPTWRDQWYFSPSNQFLATRGYLVLQVNYRGSSGYGAEYQKKGLYSRLDTIVLDDIADGAKNLIAEGIADPQRVAIMGGSFGGWVTYMSLIKYPELYRAGIAIAAVAHWKKQLAHDRLTYDNSLSYDFWKDLLQREDFAQNEKYIDPLLRAGELHQPIYIMHGDKDYIVAPEESRRMVAALRKTNPQVKVMNFPNASHTYWSFEDRVIMFNEIESFLHQHLTPASTKDKNE